MSLGIIVQARMSSQRLPGKVMREMGGKPILQYLVERLRNCKCSNEVVVATSIDESDDVVAKWCASNNVLCCRDSLNNVANRFLRVLDAYAFDCFVRINADSPLLDQRLIDEAVMIFLDGQFDIVTNTAPRAFPKGQSVEVLRTDIFRKSYVNMEYPEDYEHVTPYFYRNAKNFNIYNFNTKDGVDYSHINLCVDTMDDFKRFERICGRMTRSLPSYDWKEIVNIYKSDINV